MAIQSPEIQELWHSCQHLARGAGRILRDHLHTHFRVEYKSNRFDLVTDVDKRSEAYLVESIRRLYPDAGILGEEGGTYQQGSLLWIIDPLDGTVNFAHHLPIFSVSVAVADQNGNVLAGAIYQPMLEELFSAARGKGAFLNETPLHVSDTDSLDRSLLVTGFPYNVAENPNRCIDQFVAFLQKGLPIRRLGSAALDLAYVAAGRFDGFWEVELNPWDVAAGILIVEEAGGIVTTYEGEPHPVVQPNSLVASNGQIHAQMLEVIQRVKVQPLVQQEP